MKSISLINELKKFPEDSFAYPCKEENIGIRITDQNGKKLGFITSPDWNLRNKAFKEEHEISPPQKKPSIAIPPKPTMEIK
jgi:hypothetical protein